ncbi:uncharacterized protein BYT42DRAFT_489477, partial [Radiomyces spectabilis]|uniref:uncharacterized protein n=1 Tax=Radiomyces spectabilis TaxID=64574 RepID=UPI002220127C
AVPTWTEAPNTESTNGSTKRESLSWTDSLMDDSDNSMATSRLSTTWTTNRSREGRRRSKDLLKMLHQVQADLLVKKELVGQLEKSEVEYTQMRESYEEKLDALQDHLLEMQKQRDLAYRKAGFRTQAPQTVLQLREARQAQEVRHSYEAKMKRLTTENHDLRRKYTQATQTVETAKNKAEGLIRRLRSDIESLKSDKKQLQKALRVESDKARESVSHLEREIQQLKRKEAMSVEAHKKMEDMYETQNQALKKRTDEVAALSSQLRQLVGHLRRTANEGTLMNEAVLEKLMNAIQYRSTKSPHRTSMIAD